jgi:hypothetical protein
VGRTKTTRIANYDINANDFATDKTLHAQVGYHPDLPGVFFYFYFYKKETETERERERERERQRQETTSERQ